MGDRPPPGWVRGRSGSRHYMAGQYSHVLLGRHLVCNVISNFCAVAVFMSKTNGLGQIHIIGQHMNEYNCFCTACRCVCF